jgi:glycosyltransferase involved in cell wall biosynthesis
MSPEVVLVVPCYNEARRLPEEVFARYLADHPQVSVLFVDDGSTDRTADVIQSVKQQRPQQVTYLRLSRNLGKAEAVRLGLLRAFEAGATLAGYWDADLSTPLDELAGLLDVLHSSPDVDIVLGSRVALLGRQIERSPWRHYAGRVFATAASLALRLVVYDTQCGAKLLRNTPLMREVLRSPFRSRWVFDVELIQRYLRRTRETGIPEPAARLCEVPLGAWRDVGESKIGLSDGFRAIWDLLRIWLS